MMSSTPLDKRLRSVLRCFYRILHLPLKSLKGKCIVHKLIKIHNDRSFKRLTYVMKVI